MRGSGSNLWRLNLKPRTMLGSTYHTARWNFRSMLPATPRIGVPSTTKSGSVSRFSRTATRSAVTRKPIETPRRSSSENKSPIFLGNSYGIGSDIKNAGANGDWSPMSCSAAQPTMSARVSETLANCEKPIQLAALTAGASVRGMTTRSGPEGK